MLDPRPPALPHREQKSYAAPAYQDKPMALHTSFQALPRLKHMRKSLDANGREFSKMFPRITIHRLTGGPHLPQTAKGHGRYGEQQVPRCPETSRKLPQGRVQVHDMFEGLHGRDPVQASAG